MSYCPAGSPNCGYVSDGDEQADTEHMRWEHSQCGECGATPRDGDSVTHSLSCPRLQPGYAYPRSVRAQAREDVRQMWRAAFGTDPS
jgi:hypothetical protein